MYLYQTRFGSLYLHIGIISSVFMVGLTAGASLISYLITRKEHQGKTVMVYVLAVIAIHTILLAAVAFWPAEQWEHSTFAVAFALCGLCTGCYFPLAARQLADNGFETGRAGGKLEMADHLGASAGGLLTGLALVPMLGTRLTLLVFAVLILANVPLAAIRTFKAQFTYPQTLTLKLRRVGYVLLGVGLSVIFCSNLLAGAGAELRPSLPQHTAKALAGEASVEQVSKTLADDGLEIDYFGVSDTNDNLTGYIFSSGDLAPEARGFGGKMNLGIYVDKAGRLINFHIIRSNETPAYLDMLSEADVNGVTWYERLNGRGLFGPEPFANIDSVTGATVSCDAILSALQTSGHKFATQILKLTLQADTTEKTQRASPPYLWWTSYLPDKTTLYLLGSFAVTLIVVYWGGFWSRLTVLVLNLVIGGIWLNAQYSSEQIANILSLHTPAMELSGAFLLAVGIPILVAIFGNIYCGYICPFGAAQELLGYLIPGRLPLRAEAMQKARFVKYAVLFMLVVLFFLSRNKTTLAADPLIAVFSGSRAQYTVALGLTAGIVLVGSLFYTRFWCRYLCPVGAFLSLFNNIALLKRYLPIKKFGKCEFGLGYKDQMDCIYCDRCRYMSPLSRRASLDTPEARPLEAELLSRYLLVGVVLAAVFVSGISLNRFSRVTTGGFGQPPASVSAAGGQPRDVNMQRIRTLIRQKKLSDREAEFYRKAE
jgi:Na+-translocating ferredoxin:NAD+ oxidoreductase RnfG subunit